MITDRNAASPHLIPASRRALGRALITVAGAGLAGVVLVQALHAGGFIAIGFSNWRPVL
ncbi:MAG: hypothetical protein RLY92_57, partial [Chloroflexota bacterium]